MGAARPPNVKGMTAGEGLVHGFLWDDGMVKAGLFSCVSMELCALRKIRGELLAMSHLPNEVGDCEVSAASRVSMSCRHVMYTCINRLAACIGFYGRAESLILAALH